MLEAFLGRARVPVLALRGIIVKPVDDREHRTVYACFDPFRAAHLLLYGAEDLPCAAHRGRGGAATMRSGGEAAVDDELHAASGSIRLTRLNPVAYSSTARMSSASRSG